ncbi:MAG: hypothetical protein E6K68_03140 [Nitrospirae bacterium]|nr:MAG: hypothetical protein E6K68_03140 [Nitrospirota bacterium]
MFTTAEVRWFFEGPIPDEIERWFYRSSLAHHAGPREDYYLLLPASLGLGLKLREGRLEMKTLVESRGIRAFTANAVGKVQVWKKEAYGGPAVKEFERLRSSAPHLWLAVRKERTLRKFSLEGATIVEVPAHRVFLRDGCNAELTKVIVDGSAHWSFYFEAYGNRARVEDYVQKAAVHVLKDDGRPHLFKTSATSADSFSATNSRSYLKWLVSVPSARTAARAAYPSARSW